MQPPSGLYLPYSYTPVQETQATRGRRDQHLMTAFQEGPPPPCDIPHALLTSTSLRPGPGPWLPPARVPQTLGDHCRLCPDSECMRNTDSACIYAQIAHAEGQMGVPTSSSAAALTLRSMTSGEQRALSGCFATTCQTSPCRQFDSTQRFLTASCCASVPCVTCASAPRVV